MIFNRLNSYRNEGGPFFLDPAFAHERYHFKELVSEFLRRADHQLGKVLMQKDYCSLRDEERDIFFLGLLLLFVIVSESVTLDGS